MKETFVVVIVTNDEPVAEFDVTLEPYRYVELHFKRPGRYFGSDFNRQYTATLVFQRTELDSFQKMNPVIYEYKQCDYYDNTIDLSFEIRQGKRVYFRNKWRLFGHVSFQAYNIEPKPFSKFQLF